MHQFIFCALLILAQVVGSPDATAQASPSGPQLASLERFHDGSFQFQSVRSATWAQVATAGRRFAERSAKTWVPARLFLPKRVAGKVPAMVIEHGIGGLYYRDGRVRPYVEYAELLAEAGIAALVIDSHGGRGIGATRMMDSGQVSVYAFVADVFSGAEMLRTHPLIDGERIGVMGFSKGGMTTLLAVDRRFVDAFTRSGTPFFLHIAVYPGCQAYPEKLRATGAPVHFLLGGKDNYTGTGSCYEIERKLQEAGNATSVRVYANAFHSWDEDARPFRVDDVSSADCRWILKDDGSVWGGGMAKAIETDAESDGYFRACVRREEIYVGRVDAAYQAGRRDVVDISRRVLLASMPAGSVRNFFGNWTGTLSCSANLQRGLPEFVQALTIVMSESSGSARVEDAQTVENFQMKVASQGDVVIESQGAWKNDASRRWVLRTSGRIEGHALQASGAMYAGDGQTVVRERCAVALRRAF